MTDTPVTPHSSDKDNQVINQIETHTQINSQTLRYMYIINIYIFLILTVTFSRQPDDES